VPLRISCLRLFKHSASAQNILLKLSLPEQLHSFHSLLLMLQH